MPGMPSRHGSFLAIAAIASMLLLVAAAVTLQPEVVDAHEADRCGRTERGIGATFRIRSHDTSCDRAKEVARKWRRECLRTEPGCSPRRVVRIGQHYDCYYREVGFETVKVACLRGMKTVRFRWGV